MTNPSSSQKMPFNTTKLSQDMATLVNNPRRSDIQFRVGGCAFPASPLQESAEVVHDESATVTLYAHSNILCCRSRYFDTMLNEETNWKENTNGVIYKPNISASIFKNILHFIYTGDFCVESYQDIIELIIAAEEMNLEELSTTCQTYIIRIIKNIFSDENIEDSDEGEMIGSETYKKLMDQHIPIDVAINTYIIPALNLASSHSLQHLYHKLLMIVLPNMSIIIKLPDVYTTLLNEISFEMLTKAIESDDLEMEELDIWDLVLSWGCHQTNLSKTAIEAHLSNTEDNEKPQNNIVIDDAQLNQLKTILTPILPAIRFSHFECRDYTRISGILNYFLSHRRFTKLNQFFLNSKQLDMPTNRTEQKVTSKIITNSTLWEFLRENIFKTGGISGCSSLNDLKFKLLFRASEHSFLAKNFHQHCDDKGPTLVLVRSADGHLFGGVNFNHWKSNKTFSTSSLNFLFALPDENHRKVSAIFRINDQTNAKYSSGNYDYWGPTFGSYRGASDLYIVDSADTSFSHSNLPNSYNGSGASKTALAGAYEFKVSDYEVFSIHKR